MEELDYTKSVLDFINRATTTESFTLSIDIESLDTATINNKTHPEFSISRRNIYVEESRDSNNSIFDFAIELENYMVYTLPPYFYASFRIEAEDLQLTRVLTNRRDAQCCNT